ncbi:MAG: hypothetical protein ABIA78_02555 [archaeon]
MQIQTEQDMINFCNEVNTSGKPFDIKISDDLTPSEVENWEKLREQYDNFPGAQLKQGIKEITLSNSSPAGKALELNTIPYLHPFAKTPEGKPELKCSMTGVFVNCVDTSRYLVLLQVRGKNIESEYSFQNAASGFGKFRVPLLETARTELFEEAGIEYARFLFDGRAVDFLPFKAGDYYPPLASFTCENVLSDFPYFENLESILEFREKVIMGIKEGAIKEKEGHHFTVPYRSLEKIAGELNNQGRFYGPVYDSIINSMRALKNNKMLG